METVSLKLDETVLIEIDETLGKHRYGTRTEFIRDAIREKLSEFEKQDVLKELVRLKGSSKRKTSDADVHKAREKAVDELEKKWRPT